MIGFCDKIIVIEGIPRAKSKKVLLMDNLSLLRDTTKQRVY